MTNDTIPDEVVELFRKFGKRGGDTTKRKYGKRHFSEAGKIGMAKRWGQTKRRQHESRHTPPVAKK